MKVNKEQMENGCFTTEMSKNSALRIIMLLCFCSVLSEIAQSVTLETIETLAFNNLPNLSEM